MRLNEILFLIIALLTVSFHGYSQIEFESGYFIDDSGKKNDCFIKNVEWKNNPDNFKYKISQNSEIQKNTIENVVAFGSPNKFKFIRARVKIDRSNANIGKLSKEKKPNFKEEEVFLKVLIEGKASLYMFSDASVKRYFFQHGNSEIKQLIYKKYKTKDNKLGYNNRYKQQLSNELNCTIGRNINKLKYSSSSLINYFRKYNQCTNSTYVDYQKIKKDRFNLNLRPRLYSTSLTTINPNSSFKNTDFGGKTGFGLGIEAEFILPFHKNKLAIIFEANYQNFKSNEITEEEDVSDGILIAEVDYKPIETSVGIRYYYYLNKKSKIYTNISFITDISNNSTLAYKRGDGSILELIEIDYIKKWGFGIGYKFDNKISAEIRFKKSKEQLGNTFFWNTEHNTTSIIFGYSIF